MTRIVGNALNNMLIGGPNEDLIKGLGGADTLYGCGKNDVLFGGTVIYAGGKDNLIFFENAGGSPVKVTKMSGVQGIDRLLVSKN